MPAATKKVINNLLAISPTGWLSSIHNRTNLETAGPVCFIGGASPIRANKTKDAYILLVSLVPSGVKLAIQRVFVEFPTNVIVSLVGRAVP